MIRFTNKGNFNKTSKFLKRSLNRTYLVDLEKYGRLGVDALAKATPVDSNLTASSWSYKVTETLTKCSIEWFNSNVVSGVPIAIILQYGHGTKNGGYVEGVDYINPALKPIFENLANEAWREVTKP